MFFGLFGGEKKPEAEMIAEARSVSTRGEPVYSRYNAPFVPWFMRRNEIWLHVD